MLMKINITLSPNDFISLDKELIVDAIDTGIVTFISQSYASAALKLFSKDEDRAELFGNIADAFLNLESNVIIDDHEELIHVELCLNAALPADIEDFIKEDLQNFVIEKHHSLHLQWSVQSSSEARELSSYHKTWTDILRDASFEFVDAQELELK